MKVRILYSKRVLKYSEIKKMTKAQEMRLFCRVANDDMPPGLRDMAGRITHE